MNYLSLGATGLRVSRLAVGTAAFGLDRYGIPGPGNGRVDRAEAMEMLACAADKGVNLFDTAPGYGTSEDLLGSALADRRECVFATKVTIPEDLETISNAELIRRVNASLDHSLRALRRDVLDIVQIHNATVSILQQGEMVECLERMREQGKVRYIGASVYGEEAALAALRTGKIQVLQIALSVLDQRMCGTVIPMAMERGVGVLSRSALLKGVLTEKAQWLPERLSKLTDASRRALATFGSTWETLPSMALRFCVSLPGVDSVLSGIRNRAELDDCMTAMACGSLDPDVLQQAFTLGLDDECLLNPTNWKLEEIDTHLAQL